MMICYLWPQNSPFPLKKYFFSKSINIIFMHLSKILELLPTLSGAIHRALSELKNKNL